VGEDDGRGSAESSGVRVRQMLGIDEHAMERTQGCVTERAQEMTTQMARTGDGGPAISRPAAS